MTTATVQDSKLVKIAKLLRQAEKAGTEAEAEVFMAKAQELGTLHSIDLALARQHTAREERQHVRTQEVRNVSMGSRGTKGLYTYVALMSGIAGANDVLVNIAHDSTYMILFGYTEDIDMCERLFESLAPQMTRGWLEYKKSAQYLYDKQEASAFDYRSWSSKPVSGLTMRLNYQHGWALAASRKLRTAAKETKAAAVAADVTTSSSTELALRNKEVEVRSFYNEKSRARGHYKGGKGGGYAEGAMAQGRRDGAQARTGGERGIGSRPHSSGSLR